LAWALLVSASLAMSHTNAAWPSEARMVEACGRADVTVASFRDNGVILGLNDIACLGAGPR
jgi:hypothetical protein